MWENTILGKALSVANQKFTNCSKSYSQCQRQLFHVIRVVHSFIRKFRAEVRKKFKH